MVRIRPRCRLRAPVHLRRTLALMSVAVVASAGCSGSGNDGAAGPASGASLTGTPTTTTVPIVGEPVNQFTFSLGECANRYEVGTQIITTRVSCEEPHQREVYATLTHPAPFGEPWPGEDALQRYGLRLCYQGFEAFAGVIYELSELGIGVLTPPKLNWEDERARYRGITCYAARNDGRPLVGSMRGKAM